MPMKARLVAVGERPPAWVAEGYADYAKRLSRELSLELVEVPPGLRGKGRDAARALQDEGGRVLAALPRNAWVVALDGDGRPYSSEQLAGRLATWRQQGRDLAFLIGGPEGHAPEVRARADEGWSLGPATLPHMLVRLLVAEQLYRACSILGNHPYHRA
jgi:23S rRNA (pseudouridine1915-N3)-methyltransferase